MTEAEQNRLIIDNMSLVEPVAANYRGQKGIPFEDLVASGREGLVKAARTWRGIGDFTGYALTGIDLSIYTFVRDWQHLEVVGESDLDSLDRDFYEWQNFMATPYECWTSLDATPEGLLLEFEQLGHDRQAVSSAMIGLTQRERKMVWARFFRQPEQTLNSIAHDHKVSYSRTVFVINRALRKMAAVLTNLENKSKTEGGRRYPAPNGPGLEPTPLA